MDENKIEVLETIDDSATNSTSPDWIFQLDPKDNSANETEIYSESREHKSIMKFIIVTLNTGTDQKFFKPDPYQPDCVYHKKMRIWKTAWMTMFVVD